MASFAALLRDRAKELTRHLAGAMKGEMRSVHQGRVASRRLRESLPAAGRRGSAMRARKSFREITRALGPVRELDVALEHLDDGLRGSRISRIAIERVRAHVLAERERRRERMLARLERVDLKDALANVETVAGEAPQDVSPSSGLALARRVRGRALSLAAAIEATGTLYHPDRLHAVRIAGKKLRYALEVVASTTPADVAAELRLLKRVQERLGIMHDYQVLLEHVAAVADVTPRGTPGAAGLKAMAAAYDRECRKLHADYLKIAPTLASAALKLRKLDLRIGKTKLVQDSGKGPAPEGINGRVVPRASRDRRRARE